MGDLRSNATSTSIWHKDEWLPSKIILALGNSPLATVTLPPLSTCWETVSISLLKTIVDGRVNARARKPLRPLAPLMASSISTACANRMRSIESDDAIRSEVNGDSALNAWPQLPQSIMPGAFSAPHSLHFKSFASISVESSLAAHIPFPGVPPLWPFLTTQIIPKTPFPSAFAVQQ